jgi:hypothetical protein
VLVALISGQEIEGVGSQMPWRPRTERHQFRRLKLNIEHLKERLSYEPETGVFRWIKPRIGMKAGAVAGYVNDHGYIVINTGGRMWKAHRLAWWFVHGEEPNGLMDHINGSRTDNRIKNLRVVTAQQNAMNRCARCDSKTGIKGISWRADKSRWIAEICKDGKRVQVGSFKKREDAAAAYQEAARQLHGQYAKVV